MGSEAMKYFLFLKICVFTLLAGSTSLAAAGKFGNFLPLSYQAGGRPQLNVAFDYEAEIFWLITFKSGLSADEVEALPSKVFWNVWSDRENKYLSTWQKIHRSELKNGTLKIIDRMVLMDLLPYQKQTKIVFSWHKGERYWPLYHMDIGQLCQNYERHFFDVPRDTVGCHVDPAVVSGWAEECRQIADSLAVRIVQKLVSCKWAQRVFFKQGCGQFICSRRD